MSGRQGLSGASGRVWGTAQRYAEQLEPTAVGRFWSRLLEVEFVDRAVALAAKLLVCIFPLLVLVVAISPDATRQAILDTMVSRFGLSGGALDVVRLSFESPEETRTATGCGRRDRHARVRGVLHHRVAADLSSGLATASRRGDPQQAPRRRLGWRCARPVRHPRVAEHRSAWTRGVGDLLGPRDGALRRPVVVDGAPHAARRGALASAAPDRDRHRPRSLDLHPRLLRLVSGQRHARTTPSSAPSG